MGEKTTFIKLDRSIEKWRWYKDGNTMRVFLHLLLNANVVPHDFENITIERGSLATSYDSLSGTLNLTKHQVRTAITHLKDTGTITSKIHKKFQVITIVNYDYYQRSNAPSNPPSAHPDRTLSAPSWHQYNNVKNDKNEKNIYSSFHKKKSPSKNSPFDHLPGVTEL